MGSVCQAGLFQPAMAVNAKLLGIFHFGLLAAGIGGCPPLQAGVRAPPPTRQWASLGVLAEIGLLGVGQVAELSQPGSQEAPGCWKKRESFPGFAGEA